VVGRPEDERSDVEAPLDVGGWAAPPTPYADVGDRVTGILAAAEETAARIRAEAETEAAEIRERAEADAEGRVRELARMLSGLADSDTGQAHARELLAVARG
jgi:regulator of protease activity HflC (stomatin/prohibitin superfamily)